MLAVWKLDRLSRSLRDVLTIMERFGEAGRRSAGSSLGRRRPRRPNMPNNIDDSMPTNPQSGKYNR